MRPTVVLLTAAEHHEQLLRRIREGGSYAAGQYFDYLDRGACRFGIDASGDALEDFDESELAEVTKSIGEYRALTLEYPSTECVRELLVAVLQGVSGVLDTNYGELIPYHVVLERFEQDPEWDWRRA